MSAVTRKAENDDVVFRRLGYHIVVLNVTTVAIQNKSNGCVASTK